VTARPGLRAAATADSTVVDAFVNQLLGTAFCCFHEGQVEILLDGAIGATHFDCFE
jgi:hypothetical protein